MTTVVASWGKSIKKWKIWQYLFDALTELRTARKYCPQIIVQHTSFIRYTISYVSLLSIRYLTLNSTSVFLRRLR